MRSKHLNTKFNILDEWKKKFYLNSSQFSIRKLCKRENVKEVISTLSGFFGKEYFDIQYKGPISLEKLNWLFSLMSYNNPQSYRAIREITHLIEYSKNLNRTIYDKLKSCINSPAQFQDLVFELYTYRILDLNNIENSKKVWVNNQEIEGICNINGSGWEFECKKSRSDEAINFASEIHWPTLKILPNKNIEFMKNKKIIKEPVFTKSEDDLIV